MVVIGGADEAVVGDVHQLPESLDAGRALDDGIDKLLRGDAGFLCLVLDLLTVFIGAGEEHDIVPLQPLVAGHRVCGSGAVTVTNVQHSRALRDRRGNIKWSFAHQFASLKCYLPL